MKTTILAACLVVSLCGTILATVSSAETVPNWMSYGVNALLAWYVIHDVRVTRPRVEQEKRDLVEQMGADHQKQLDRQSKAYERIIELHATTQGGSAG